MLLLFSDGVTDCLTEEEIAVVCRQTDKKLIAKKVVERALTKDSSAYDYLTDDDLEEYWQFNEKIKAGKDNSTAVRFTPNKQDEEER